MKFVMKRVKKEVVKITDFYPKYLKLINVILPHPLTQKEIEVLSAFMELKGDLVESNRFGTEARRLIRNKFGFKTHSNIDNYIKYFRTKGILVKNKDTGLLEMNKVVSIPSGEEEIELVFRFKIDHGNDEKSN
jgi:hypothetical protein